MDSSCVPAGTSYLVALGFGVLVVVLSPWLVLLGRAVYGDGPAFQRGLWNAAPLWVPAMTGAVVLYAFGGSLVDWMDLCLPNGEWGTPSVVVVGLGVVVACVAVVRMIVGRVRVGSGSARSESGDDTDSLHPSAAAGASEAPRRNLPPEKRRVIVAYAITYGAAVTVIMIGVGLAG